MITLYSPQETDFSHDGLGILDEALSCTVTREIGDNPYWEVEMEYPLHASKADRITELSIVKVPTPSGLQPFRITEVSKNLDSINVVGQHIAFDLAKNYVTSVSLKGATRQQAIEAILNSTIARHNFKYEGIDNNSSTHDIDFSSRNVLDCIMGAESSVFNIWGSGQLDMNGYSLYSKDELGENRGLSIAFGKNMTGITSYTDMNDVVTRIIPVSKDGIVLPEVYIDSKYINNYHQPLIKKIVFDSIEINTEAGINQDKVYELLRAEAKKMFDAGVDIPSVSYEVSFIDLGNTREYQKFKGIHLLDIGDIVRVENELLNMDLDMKIRNYKYNSLIGEFDNLQIGTQVSRMSSSLKTIQSLETNLTEINNSLNQKISDTSSNVSNVRDELQNNVTNVKNELQTDVTNVKNELQTDVNNVRNELQTDIDSKVNLINVNVTNISNRVGEVDSKIDATNQNLTTIRNELKTEIDKKIEEADVKPIIASARAEVRTALNNNVVTYGISDIVVTHNTGTTSLNNNGLMYTDGNITSNYLFLKHTETFQTVDENEFQIDLPVQFRGKNFTPFVSLVDTLETVDPYVLTKVEIKVSRVDIANGQVFVIANKTETNKGDAMDTKKQPIVGQLLVIA